MGRMPEKWEAAQKSFGKKLKTFARNSYSQIPGMSQEDMEQELLETLWWCTFDYNPNGGATFNTFVQTSWRNRIGTLKRSASTQKRACVTVSLDEASVAFAVDAILADRSWASSDSQSAEDTALLRIMIREQVAERGVGAIVGYGRRTA